MISRLRDITYEGVAATPNQIPSGEVSLCWLNSDRFAFGSYEVAWQMIYMQSLATGFVWKRIGFIHACDLPVSFCHQHHLFLRNLHQWAFFSICDISRWQVVRNYRMSEYECLTLMHQDVARILPLGWTTFLTSHGHSLPSTSCMEWQNLEKKYRWSIIGEVYEDYNNIFALNFASVWGTRYR